MSSSPHPPRSRTAWPGPMSTAGMGEGHTHELPQALIDRIAMLRRAFCIVSLAMVLALGFLAYYVYQQQQYIAGKGEQRDRENVRLEEQIRQSICDLLDQLPEGGLLDRPRAKYGCGSGVPLSEFPPAVQDQLRDRPSVPPADAEPALPPQDPPPASEPPPVASQAPEPPPAPESPVPPPTGADGPMQPAEPPPVSPPSQLRDVLCGLLPICREEPA